MARKEKMNKIQENQQVQEEKTANDSIERRSEMLFEWNIMKWLHFEDKDEKGFGWEALMSEERIKEQFEEERKKGF